MASKAKIIGAVAALAVVGAACGAITFADDLDRATASLDNAADATDAPETGSAFVRFGLAAPVVRVGVAAPGVRVGVAAPGARVGVAPRVGHRWVAGRWVGWRYHRGYWR